MDTRVSEKNVVALPERPSAVPMNRDDLEFLPPAQEILLTPPSPIRMYLIVFICALFATFLLVSWLLHIDIYAVATGRVQPAGRSKVVQPLASGQVRAIHVENGTRVAAGALLLELDPTESAAERAARATQLEALAAEIARRTSAIKLVQLPTIPRTPKIEFPANVGEAARFREEMVLAADLSNLTSTLATLDGRVAEAVAEQRAIQLTIQEQQRLVDTLRKRVDMQESVLARGLASRAAVLEAEQEYREELAALANHRGTLLRAEAAFVSLTNERNNALTKYISENSQAVVNLQNSQLQETQSLVKASSREGHTRLTAPIAGTVQQLAVTTIGQVVSAGQSLMTIVPTESRLEVEALILNRDIAFVESGQHAVIKLDAFPFTRYGSLSGTIRHVSHDAVLMRDALSPADGGLSSAQGPRGVATMVDLVYPATVVLDAYGMQIDGRKIPLTPGMSARVEIRTGERRLLEYFLSPLVLTVSEAAHER
jgi:hemolysin D